MTDTDGPGNVKLTAWLTPATDDALRRAAAFTGDTRTIALNHAVQFWDMVLVKVAAGKRLAFLGPDDTVELVELKPLDPRP